MPSNWPGPVPDPPHSATSVPHGSVVVVVVDPGCDVVVLVDPGCVVVVVVLVVEASQVAGAAHRLARYCPGASTDAVVQVEQYTSVPMVSRTVTVPCRWSSRSSADWLARTVKTHPRPLQASR